MKTFHVLILAGAILGAAWILKPVPVKQVSQAELESRERLDRFARTPLINEDRATKCAASIGKTLEALDLNDPKQAAPYGECMRPEDPRGWLRRTWDRTWAVFW